MQNHFINNTKLIISFFILNFFVFPISKNEKQHNNSIVFLNHVYLYLDSSTYSAVCNSEFLKDKFANCATKTITAVGMKSWTGTYINGRNTYIEFFNSIDEKKIGYSGIGFSVEMKNGIDSLYNYFIGLGLKNVTKISKYVKIENRKIPWFNLLSFSNGDSTDNFKLNTWIMEYKYEYMKFLYPDKNPDSLKITRKYYNQKKYRSDLLLKDIVEVEIALDKDELNKISNELKLYGYLIESKEEKVICVGPEVKIILIPKSKDKLGISKLTFTLTTELAEKRIITFGEKSKLVINKNKTAVWYFRR